MSSQSSNCPSLIVKMVPKRNKEARRQGYRRRRVTSDLKELFDVLGGFKRETAHREAGR
jgi:hypothetical protein